MPNPVNTAIDIGSVAIEGERFQDGLVNFAGAATYKAGTLLGRRPVSATVAASAVTGTGNGTVTLATVLGGPIVPMAGVYTLKVITAAVNGGTWQLTDPAGNVIATNLVMTVGAGAATVFKAGGLQFTITDGATDFAVNDTATLTVSADGNFYPFEPASGIAGAQFPIAVLTYDVTATGAGNVSAQVLVAGLVKKERLIVNSTQDGSLITTAHLDMLRDYSIVVQSAKQLSS